ncbi:alpha-L-rhamnosidase C-terminal domain-containing protein [Cohnella silvisoli]|uniref:Alpha-L-rhamnosidase C-terminal domain-containing protein n=1 Tax=Cohnella silvisoli TaxID=2873699 RepID=A0ABV1KUP3_9BACL|nr:alpha-L-rhamnosidase C-terminal domain-containing protein [Cohnella silvisoli]MCD9022915.1 alpha-L-rhamnosidase [Cohnella silvisoli]
METNGYDHTIPLWIWHEDRESKPHIILSRRFNLKHALRNVTFQAAFTGAATVSVDGQIVARVEEKAGNVDSFMRLKTFPDSLAAGEHEIQLELECTEFIPLVDVNSYLRDRRVGAIAFMQTEGYWLTTDDRWTANGTAAATICRLGEEPFGDLEEGPEWFVRGGFDDIKAFTLADYRVLESNRMLINQDQGRLLITGSYTQDATLDKPEPQNLQLFYHLRKQEQWKIMRDRQKQMNLDSASSLTVDLGKEHNCRFYVNNLAEHPAKIVWNGAESLHELEQYEGCITESFEVLPGQTYYTLPQGMRYIRIYMLGAPNRDYQMLVAFQAIHVDLRQVGSFHSDKGLLDRVYEVSAHTNKICHQIGLWDGIKRDRLNWTFDFYLAAKSCYFLWDDYKVIRRAVSELGVGTPYGSWMNGICEYTLWWLKTVCEYHFHTGDKTFVLEMREPLARHMRWIEANIDSKHGGIKQQSNILIEWTPLSDAEKQLGLQAVFALTRADLQALLAAVPELGLVCDWPLAELEEEAFVSADNQLATKVLGIASGYVSEPKSREFLEQYELQDPLTPLSAYQLAECYSKYGLHERAFRVIADVWGGMLEHGATTFWEAYTLNSDRDFHDSLTTYTSYGSYRISLCHAWSSTPVKWISENVLGVQAIEPGFTSVSFQPVSVSGMRECQGIVNTPHGPIKVQWHLDENDEMLGEIEAPQEITVIRSLKGVSSGSGSN